MAVDSYSVVYPQFQDISSTRVIQNHDNDAVHQLLSLYLNTDLLIEQEYPSKRRSSSLYWQSNMLNQTNWLGEYRSKSVLEKNTRINSRPSSIYSETEPSPRAPAKRRHKKSVSFNETVTVISQESAIEKSILKQRPDHIDDDDDEDIFVDAVETL